MQRKRSWTLEELKEAVRTSFSYRQVLNRLHLREAGGNYTQIKKYIQECELSTEHFKGRGWNAGLQGIERSQKPLEEILVKGSSFQSYKLKKRLFKAKLKNPECEQCGWAKYTEEGYLPLELDHINGDRTDNRLENLRILCPNCHSLTVSYRGRTRTLNLPG